MGTKKTTGANGEAEAEAEKDFKGVIGRVEGTSKYGKLHYRVSFEKDPGRLQVTVLGCQELKVMDLDGSSDPYVTVLLPNSPHSTLRFQSACQPWIKTGLRSM